MNKILLGLGALGVVVLAGVVGVVYAKVAGVSHQPTVGSIPAIPTRDQFVKGVEQTCVAGKTNDAKLSAFCDCVGKDLSAHLTDEDMVATKGNSLPPQVQEKINSAESACESSKS